MTTEQIVSLAEGWAKRYFKSEHVLACLLPREPDDEPEAHLVALAIAGYSVWQGCEVWLEVDADPSIYTVGECVAPENVDWPWLSDA